MKLVELLAAHLTVWPNEYRDRGETEAMTQDENKCLSTLDGGKEADVSQFRSEGGIGDGVWAGSHWTHAGISAPSELAEDYKTAIVTKEMWEAEKNKTKGQVNEQAQEPQWKRHRGGKQPVADGVMVEVKFRCGETNTGILGDSPIADWSHTNHSYDIMQYRVVDQPEEQTKEQPQTKQENEMPTVAELKVNVDVVVGFNPMFARDRIRAINSQFEVLTAERAALIQALADEGFTLVSETAIDPLLMPVVEGKVQPKQPREFQVGDSVRLFREVNSSTCMEVGEVGTITGLCLSDETAMVIKDNDSYEYWPSVKDLELVKAVEDK
jgi:hypothetical protein